MPSRVPLGTDRRSKNDQVLSDGCVNQVHGAHRAACVIEHPFLVEVHVVGVRFGEVRDDVVDHGASVVAVSGDCGLRERVKLGWVEYVEFLEVAFEHVHDGCDGRDHCAQEGEDTHGCLTKEVIERGIKD